MTGVQTCALPIFYLLQMGSRGQLGDHATVDLVNVLRQDDMAEYAMIPGKHGRGGLVARRFDSQNQHFFTLANIPRR